jgi:hypothetical protein
MTDGKPAFTGVRVALGGLLWCLAAQSAGAGGGQDFDVLHVNDRYSQPVSVVAADTGTPAIAYILHGPTGIFAVDLDPLPSGLDSLTLTLTGLSRLESVSLTTPDGEHLELHTLGTRARDGVEVVAVDDGFEVRFTGPGLERIASGGRLQVVDAWR